MTLKISIERDGQLIAAATIKEVPRQQGLIDLHAETVEAQDVSRGIQPGYDKVCLPLVVPGTSVWEIVERVATRYLEAQARPAPERAPGSGSMEHFVIDYPGATPHKAAEVAL